MGVKIFDIKDIINYSKKYISQNLNELNLLELGEQEFKIFNEEFKDTLITNFLDKNPRKWPKKSPKGRIGVYSKDFLESIFNKVVSIDNVISCKSSIKVNLINNLNTLNIEDLNQQYNIITNFGTTEHVGQYDNLFEHSQYNVFKNIHNLLKKEGILFNVVPAYDITNNKKHGAFNYTKLFFEDFANICNYKIIYNEVKNRGNILHVYCYLIKLDDKPFINKETFNKITGYYITKNATENIKKFYNNILF